MYSDVFAGMFLRTNRRYRGENRSFNGTENPCVAGSIPALPIEVSVMVDVVFSLIFPSD